MSRKAVSMTQAEFETLLDEWIQKLARQQAAAEDEEPETEQERAERLAEEAEHEAKYGRMYAWDMKLHGAFQACLELDNKIIKDLSKVNFDWENAGCDLGNGMIVVGEPEPPVSDNPCGFWITPSGVPTLGCYAGGDWEDPVYFVLYPESNSSIRAYMPKAGNTWGIKTKAAWGSGGSPEEEEGEENPRQVDVTTFRADVAARLTVF